MSIARSATARPGRRSALVRILLAAGVLAGLIVPATRGIGAAPPAHLVVSEIVTGGSSASDELIELHNPTGGTLPLEGLEVVYASASGTTVSRRATWEAGAPLVPPGGHVLIANEAGIFAPIADATYASGMSATGGSVALRILGATSTIDAVGWGTATGGWPENSPVAAPSDGASIERRPGGITGSWQDTDDNAADFVERQVPEPQNLGSPPTPDPGSPGATATPTPTPTPTTTPTPLAPGPGVTAIGDARMLPDGAAVTIEGVALTASDFHDGGGFVADASGAIAVLLTDGAFARGARLRMTGDLDDRFSQRTLRVDGAALEDLGTGNDPAASTLTTGAVGEAVEGRLIRITGAVVGSSTPLTSGRALDLDDGSGAVRVVIGDQAQIDATSWSAGMRIAIVGVVSQRDSTGSGTSGYRVMPRDSADLLEVLPATTASQAPNPSSAGGSPTAQPVPASSVLTIAAAREAPKNARVRVRGVVTLSAGIIDPQTAVIQDATGAIVLRLPADAAALGAGTHVEVAGVRSTKSGMETIRVTDQVMRLGTAPGPGPRVMRTGDADEAHEARAVIVRGALVKSARRSTSGSVSFDLDDGSGALKVVLGAPLRAESATLGAGTWVEVRGVLGQETTGAEPRAGYRVWPSSLGSLRIVASAGGGGGAASGGSGPGDTDSDAQAPTASLDGIAAPGLADLRIGATLVAGVWDELGVGGLLWDGARLVAVAPRSADIVSRLLAGGGPPLAIELGGLRATGTHPATGVPMVALGTGAGESVVSRGAMAAPRGDLRSVPAWVSIVGRVTSSGERHTIEVGNRDVPVELRCPRDRAPIRGVVSIVGVAIGDPLRLAVPCDGLRAAPTLERTASIVSLESPVAGSDEPAAASPAPRLAAAALLALAALALGSVAAYRRLLVVPPDPTGVEEAADDEDGSRRLSLVGVPREHGP